MEEGGEADMRRHVFAPAASFHRSPGRWSSWQRVYWQPHPGGWTPPNPRDILRTIGILSSDDLARDALEDIHAGQRVIVAAETSRAR
jgi:hypothetical protein